MVHLTIDDATPNQAEIVTYLNSLLGDAWKDACEIYFGELIKNRALGQLTNKPMQVELGMAIDNLMDQDFEGYAGWWRKDDLVVRITFRHKSGLDGDFFKCLRFLRYEGVKNIILIYATKEALEVISPDDKNTLSSSNDAEELARAAQELIPENVKIVRLGIKGELSNMVRKEIYSKSRLETKRGKIA
jgi:hypothetical protein